jgi:uncharacterized protein YbaP (TraB family)
MANLRVLWIACLLGISPVIRAQQDALLWRISGGGLTTPSYLYGTIHLICPDDLRLSDSLPSALARSAKLYLEIDMDEPGLMLKTMRLSMQTTTPLKELYTPEQYARLDRFLKDTLGMGASLFNKMKPFTLLSALYTRIPGCRKTVSVEERIMEMAKKQRKEVLGLETLEDQFAVFDRIPDSAQARMILDMIDHFPEQQAEFIRMVDAYRKQDLSALSAMMNTSPDMVGFEEILLLNRNRNWIPVMQKAMARESIFFAVGAGHLSGPEGLLSLLRKSGYEVNPLR